MSADYPLSSKEFKHIYSKVPRVCVDVLIQSTDGILLTLRKEDSWSGLWHIPGGTVYYRESLEDAVKRVAKDELGIDVTVINLLGYIEYFSEEKARGYGYSVSIVFLCKPSSSEYKLDHQAEEIKFFKSLPQDIVKEQKEFINKHLNVE